MQIGNILISSVFVLGIFVVFRFLSLCDCLIDTDESNTEEHYKCEQCDTIPNLINISCLNMTKIKKSNHFTRVSINHSVHN